MTGNIRDTNEGIESDQSTAPNGRRAVLCMGQRMFRMGIFISLLVLAGSLFAGVAAADPVEIGNWSELQGIEDDLNKDYVLVTNLTEDTEDYPDIVGEGDGFNPIGEPNDGFEGIFNGSGHTISDLTIDREGDDYVGLFGVTGSDAVIKNVGLVDANITGDQRVGILVGENSGDIYESYATGVVSGSENDVGGLVGYNSGDISNTYATGEVVGSGDRNVGGLVGHNVGDISKSYAISTVDGNGNVGGLVGFNADGANVDVSESYWDDEAATVIEGGAEVNGQGIGGGDDSGVTARSTDEMTGENAEGNLNGFDFDDTWMVDADDPENGFTLSYPVLQNNTQVPALSTTLYADGNGTVDNPYQIADWVHLDNVRETLDANFTLVNDLDTGATGYEITASGSANDNQGFDPIGNSTNKFVGSLDGNGNEIQGLTINRTSDDVGLIGYAGTNGDEAQLTNVTLADVDIVGRNAVGSFVGNSTYVFVRNVTVRGGTVEGTGNAVGGLVGAFRTQSTAFRNDLGDSHVDLDTVTGAANVGGMVGTTAEGTARVWFGDSSTNATVEGHNNVGGFVGQFSFDRIENVTTAGSVTASTKGTANAGGIVGLSDRPSTSISASSSSATVSSPGTNVGGAGGLVRSDFSGLVATGNVTGGSQVGGLIGKYNHTGSQVGTSYATGSVSNASASGEGFGGLIGETSGQVGGVDSDISIRGVFATGSVEGNNNTGGLVGSATAAGRDLDQVHATGSVSGVDNVGGLVGWATTDEIETTYAAGPVSGKSNTGGLVGNTTSTDIISSYWDTARSNQSTSAGGGDGLRTYQMIGDQADSRMVLTNSNVFEPVNETNAAADGYLVLAALDREPQLLFPDVDRPEFVSAEITNTAPDEIRVEFDTEVTLNTTHPTDGFNIYMSFGILPTIEAATATDRTVVLSLDRSVQAGEPIGLQYTEDMPGLPGVLNVQNTEGDEAASFETTTNDVEFENNVQSGGGGGSSGGGSGGGGGGPAPPAAIEQTPTDDGSTEVTGGQSGDVIDINDETLRRTSSLDGLDNIAVDGLSVELATDRDFFIDVETYERGQEDKVDAESESGDSSGSPGDDTPDSTRSTIAATFENETETVSVGYVTVSHNLEPEDISNVSFDFSVSQSYLDSLDVEPENVSLYRQEDDWSTLSTEYRELSQSRYRFDGDSPGFSSFAIGTNAPLSIVVNGALDQTELTEGETATATASVTNRGENAVTHTVNLTASDELVATETVTVDGGETVEVPLAFDPAAGSYEMTVDEVDIGSLTVAEPATSPLWLLVVLFAILLIGMVVWRRHNDEGQKEIQGETDT